MNQRRKFLKDSLVGIGVAVVLPSLSLAQESKRRGGGDLPLVEPGKGMAASVNYVHSTSDIKNASLKKDRQGVPFAKQSCANCMLYQKHGMKDGAEVGKCSLFAGQVVKASGWCGSWSKKG